MHLELQGLWESTHVDWETMWLLIQGARRSLMLLNGVFLHYLSGYMPKILSLACPSLESASLLIYLVTSSKKTNACATNCSPFPVINILFRVSSPTVSSRWTWPGLGQNGGKRAKACIGETGLEYKCCQLHSFSRAQAPWPRPWHLDPQKPTYITNHIHWGFDYSHGREEGDYQAVAVFWPVF